MENFSELNSFFYPFSPHAECLGLPWRSGSALLPGWLDRWKCHTFIYRGPISECGGKGPQSSPVCAKTTDHVCKIVIADTVVAVCLQVWFAWLVLNMEGMFEDDSQLRRCVENELLSEPSIFPEQALKVCKKSTGVLTWITVFFF